MATSETQSEPSVSKDKPLQIQASAAFLNDLLAPVMALVDETRVQVSDDGLLFMMADPANVGMVRVNVPASAFAGFATHTPRELGVNLGRLEAMLSVPDSDDIVTLRIDAETRKLHIETEEGFEGTMALIDPDSVRESPTLPDLDLPAEIIIEGADLDRARKAADMVSDHIEFGVDPDEEVFYARAQGDTDDIEMELTRDDVVDLTAGEASSLFSLDYIKSISGPIGTGTEVTVELGTEFPVVVQYQLGEGDIHVTNLVAPRIQSE